MTATAGGSNCFVGFLTSSAHHTNCFCWVDVAVVICIHQFYFGLFLGRLVIVLCKGAIASIFNVVCLGMVISDFVHLGGVSIVLVSWRLLVLIERGVVFALVCVGLVHWVSLLLSHFRGERGVLCQVVRRRANWEHIHVRLFEIWIVGFTLFIVWKLTRMMQPLHALKSAFTHDSS